MRNLIILCVVALVGAWAFGAAQGSVFIPGTVTWYEDEDFEAVYNRDGSTDPDTGDPTLTAGDYLFGVWKVSTTYDAYNTGNTINPDMTAVFLLEVMDLDVPDYTPTTAYPHEFRMKPAALADLDGGGSADDDPWDVFLGVSRVSLDTIAVVYEGASPTSATVTVDGSVKDEVATFADGTALWELGFALNDGTEFWYATASDNLTNSVGVQYVASLNVTADDDDGLALSGDLLLPHAFLDTVPNLIGVQAQLWPFFGGSDLFSQVQLQGESTRLLSQDLLIKTDSDIFVYGIPEPVTVGIWAVLFGVAGCVGALRRRRK